MAQPNYQYEKRQKELEKKKKKEEKQQRKSLKNEPSTESPAAIPDAPDETPKQSGEDA